MAAITMSGRSSTSTIHCSISSFLPWAKTGSQTPAKTRETPRDAAGITCTVNGIPQQPADFVDNFPQRPDLVRSQFQMPLALRPLHGVGRRESRIKHAVRARDSPSAGQRRSARRKSENPRRQLLGPNKPVRRRRLSPNRRICRGGTDRAGSRGLASRISSGSSARGIGQVGGHPRRRLDHGKLVRVDASRRQRLPDAGHQRRRAGRVPVEGHRHPVARNHRLLDRGKIDRPPQGRRKFGLESRIGPRCRRLRHQPFAVDFDLELLLVSVIEADLSAWHNFAPGPSTMVESPVQKRQRGLREAGKRA